MTTVDDVECPSPICRFTVRSTSSVFQRFSAFSVSNYGNSHARLPSSLSSLLIFCCASQTMKIASLQRLLTWSGVCRSLLGEKDEDRSAPRSMWDQTIGTFGCFRTGASTRGSFNSTTSGSGSGGDCAGAPGTGREELAGREPRLTDEQRTALRLLCGNLAAFPPIPQQSSTAEPGGERGETSAENGGTSGLPGVESCPHHHHSVSSPFIPFSMSRVELQPRTWWRDVHQVPDVANTGAAAAPSPMPAHISAPGYHGAGTGVAVADHPDASNSVAANGASMMRPHRAPAGDSGATLLNTQPACGRGGVYWPTLYDLTRVKNRQEERLRDCFRRFSPGQRVDVRDPSGVWMGAVVLYAPRSCGGGAWHDFNDGDVFHHAGHGGHGGAGGGGGGAHVEGGVNVPGVQASLHPHHDATTPEWRRLLQLALVADGGHIRLARLRAGRYRGPAAGGLPAAGSAPSCIVRFLYVMFFVLVICESTRANGRVEAISVRQPPAVVCSPLRLYFRCAVYRVIKPR